MALTVAATRAIARQIEEIINNPIEGIALRPTDDLSLVEADITGPEDTPFYAGSFYVALHLSEAYPAQPPKGYFHTKIFHPNVSERGEICVNTLKRDWNSSLGLRHILTVIRCLLIEPNPESALNEEAGRLLLEHYDEYFKRAQMFTAIHAGGPGASAPSSASPSSAAAAAAGAALREADISTANTANNSNSTTGGNSQTASSKNGGGSNSGGASDKPAAATEKKATDNKKRAALKRL